MKIIIKHKMIIKFKKSEKIFLFIKFFIIFHTIKKNKIQPIFKYKHIIHADLQDIKKS